MFFNLVYALSFVTVTTICFCYKQIAEEFFRITNKDLLDVFMAAMDRFTPKLLKLYRARKAAFGEDMEQLLERLDERASLVS